MNDAMLSIVATECRIACEGEPDFIERIRKAMKPVADGHWMVTDDDTCFRGAIGGVLLAEETTDEEKERISFTLGQIRAIGALQSGVPVDLERMTENPENIELIPLIKLWHEAKEGK